jgi:hypothetical protein
VNGVENGVETAGLGKAGHRVGVGHLALLKTRSVVVQPPREALPWMTACAAVF